jgi:hypothetical protein
LSGNVLRAIFAEFTHKLAESWGDRLFAKEVPQALRYLLANGRIVLPVDVQVSHLGRSKFSPLDNARHSLCVPS